jgi:hypothetical protein
MSDKILEGRTNQIDVSLHLTNSVEQSSARETDNRSAGQQIPCHL